MALLLRQRTPHRSAAARALVAALLVLALGGASAAATAASTLSGNSLTPQYRLVDLGTLGGTTINAAAINASGQVVGAASLSGDCCLFHAFLYSNGRMNDMGTLGGDDSIAHDINSRSDV